MQCQWPESWKHWTWINLLDMFGTCSLLVPWMEQVLLRESNGSTMNSFHGRRNAVKITHAFQNFAAQYARLLTFVDWISKFYIMYIFSQPNMYLWCLRCNKKLRLDLCLDILVILIDNHIFRKYQCLIFQFNSVLLNYIHV